MGSRIACALPMFTVYLLFMLAELQWSVHAMIQIRLKIVVLQVSDIYASKVVKWFKDMLDFNVAGYVLQDVQNMYKYFVIYCNLRNFNFNILLVDEKHGYGLLG